MSRVGYRGEGHPLRVLFVGFGNVGRTAGEILQDPKRYPGWRIWTWRRWG